MTIFIVINKGICEIGFEIPSRGYNVLMNNPMNIRKAMLSPTQYKMVSIVFSLFSFRIRIINNPDKNVRKRNPMICLKKGISKRMATSAEISSPKEGKKMFLASKLFKHVNHFHMREAVPQLIINTDT
jgi:hypothetical protein